MEVGGKVSIERLLADLNLDVEDIPTKQKLAALYQQTENTDRFRCFLQHKKHNDKMNIIRGADLKSIEEEVYKQRSKMEEDYETRILRYSDVLKSGFMKLEEEEPQIYTKYNPELKRIPGKFNPNGEAGIYIPPQYETREYEIKYESVANRAIANREHYEYLGDLIKKEHKIEEYSEFGGEMNKSITIIGQILRFGEEENLSSETLYLENLSGKGDLPRVKLDVSALDHITLFEGEIIAMLGEITTSMKQLLFIVNKVFKPPKLPAPKFEYEQLLRINEQTCNRFISYFVASGPFTNNLTLDYHELHILLERVKEEKPQVLILMGPFLDEGHPILASGDIQLDGEYIEYETLFISIMELINQELANLNTKVIVQPSLRDIQTHYSQPQPPFSIPGNLRDRFWMVSNPQLMNINEISLLLINTDIMKDVGEGMIQSGGESEEHISGVLAAGILQQRRMYPKYPTANDCSVDHNQISKFNLHLPPDLIITPSSCPLFAKGAGESLVINPGHASRGHSTGTYCIVTVHPMENIHMRAGVPTPLSRCRVDILKLK